MNIDAYISTGILESYVLGQVSDSERQEVEALMAKHTEIREEVQQIEASLESLAFATSVQPSAGVKSTLLAAIEESSSAPVVSIHKESRPILKYLAAASVTLALVSTLAALNYWQKWRDTEQQLSSVIAQSQAFADNYTQVNQQLDQLKESVEIASSPEYQRVVMNGTDNAAEALATVYWNQSTSKVFLQIRNLRPAIARPTVSALGHRRRHSC